MHLGEGGNRDGGMGSQQWISVWVQMRPGQKLGECKPTQPGACLVSMGQAADDADRCINQNTPS